MSAQPSRRVGLATGTYRKPVSELPQSKAPRWMLWLAVVAAVLAVAGAAVVLLGPMDERVPAPGVVRPADYALVFPAAAGLVAEVSGVPGVQVRTGDLLARLDARDLEHERDALVCTLARAEAGLADARARTATAIPPDMTLQATAAPRLRNMVAERRKLLDRMEGSGDGRGLSLIELVRERLAFQSLELEHDRAERVAELLAGPWAAAMREAAAAQVRAAEAEVAGLRTRQAHVLAEIARREVRAPVDGVLVSRSVRFPGEKAAEGTPLFKIARGGGSRLRLYAGEDRVDRIHPGQTVLFRPKSDPDRLRKPRTGLVTAVALDRDLAADEGDRPPGGTYAIDVAIAEGEADLPLGASVEAEIVLGQRSFIRLLLTKPAR